MNTKGFNLVFRIVVVLGMVLSLFGAPGGREGKVLALEETKIEASGAKYAMPESGLELTLGNSFQSINTAFQEGIISISAGYFHTCALTSGGAVKCWGDNTYGQLGNGTNIKSYLPVDVVDLASGVIAIDAGYQHTCALTSAGAVKCWGDNTYGQLGNDSIVHSNIPVDVVGLSSGIAAISVSGHSCALTTSGTVKCWGANNYGQLGNGVIGNSSVPVNVIISDEIQSISAGAGFTCALTTLGAVKCWGKNDFAQLGDGTTSDPRLTPVDVYGLSSGVLAISAGLEHSCAIVAGGGVKCWGDNLDYVLGDGTNIERLVPVAVIGLSSDVTMISAGYYNTCAVTSVGLIKCWGNNIYGQLGDGTTAHQHTPVEVVGLSGAAASVSVNYNHSCAVISNGDAMCWGWNAPGQLGDGTTETRLTPVKVQFYSSEPAPWIRAHPIWDSVDAWDWPLGAFLTLTIDDPISPDPIDYESDPIEVVVRPQENPSIWFDLAGVYDLQGGDVVTVTDGTTTRVLELSILTIDSVDTENGYVTGSAEPGASVRLPVPFELFDETDEFGDWSVDFNTTLELGSTIIAEITDDDGDLTSAEWYIPIPPNPYFDVRYNDDSIGTWEWELGTLNITIDDPATELNPDFTTSGVVEGPPENDKRNFLNFNLAGEFDIQPGFVVTVSQGELEKTHIVTSLAFTAIDLDANTVTGQANVGLPVNVWACDATDCQGHEVQLDDSGNWTINFADPDDGIRDIDLGPGTWIDSQQPDIDGDTTMYGVTILKPFIEVQRDSQWILGRNWPIGTPVTMTIDDPSTGVGIDITETVSVAQNYQNPGDPNDFTANFTWPEGGLTPGSIIIMAGMNWGFNITKTLVVNQVEMTSFNLEDDTISGIATPFGQLQVCVNLPDHCASHFVTADQDGNWTADYLNVDEKTNIQPGTSGWLYEWDADGDTNWDDWSIINPSIWADPRANYINGWGWNDGDTITIQVFEGGVELTSLTSTYHNDGGVGFDLNTATEEGIDLVAGQRITMTNGLITKELKVSPLWITDVDPNTYTISGIYDPSLGFDIWLENQTPGEPIFSGNTWSVTFDGLTRGAYSQVYQTDPDGDQTGIGGLIWIMEGYHDYTSGNSAHWNCNAGGWAVDDIDRDTDVEVQVLADGEVVATATANQPQGYLVDLCVDGSCGFEINLWGLITPYVEHEIRVQAYDQDHDLWVDLSDTPRSLTCRTNDIYSYDPASGAIIDIGNRHDTDEYNPAWSPNGKKVAYDLVNLDGVQLGIYITDIKTNASTPLKGAEGGNDAAWSPNGEWIAFDNGYPDPLASNLYIVRSAGGTRRLVRANAINASWAPNSRRLVFQQPNDGTLRTKSIDGSGGETLLGTGNYPAWSPDGKWIAYENGGDLWKMRVNGSGVKQADPVQLTSGLRLDESPTWSPDGLTIVFHGDYGGDYDLWSIPASGGEATWLNGAPGYWDLDPAYAWGKPLLAYSSWSPNGQAPRQWFGSYTSSSSVKWEAGEHSYTFWLAGEKYGTREFTVNPTNEIYENIVLLRPSYMVACNNGGLEYPEPFFNIEQPTLFNFGWMVIDETHYSDVKNYLGSLDVKVSWDGGAPIQLTRFVVFPLTGNAWDAYLCGLTNP